MALARRILAVERSPFYSIMELASKRKDCIYLHLGEPDFVTPAHIIEAGRKALADGYTHYSSDRGFLELRQLISQKLKSEYGAEYSAEDEIIITAGGQASLFVAAMAVVNPEDEVILLAPYYPPYLANVQLAGAKPVFLPLNSEEEFIPKPELVEKAITEKTKAVIILTPNNPTGSAYPREVLKRLAEIAVRNNIFIISDEVYEKFIYEGKSHCSMVSFKEAKDRIILANSFSKTYAMTGWRVGYVAAARETLLQLLKFHHTINICANAAAQKASVAALSGPQECVKEMVQEYVRRRDILVKGLNGIPKIKCARPKGAFYAFADIRGLNMPSLDFVRYLVNEAGVVATNGSGFGYEGFVRVSYSAEIGQIEEAIDRMRKAVEKLLWQSGRL